MKTNNNKLLPALCLIALSGSALAEDQAQLELETVEVIGVTPLPGSNLPAEKIPANVQTVNSEQLSNAKTTSLSEYMNRYLGSVSVNEAQNNPLQPDTLHLPDIHVTPAVGTKFTSKTKPSTSTNLFCKDQSFALRSRI